jgi:hypothetical protein
MRAPNTAWVCRSCNAAGMLTIAPDAGVYEGIQALRWAHIEVGNGCPEGIGNMQVFEVKWVLTASENATPDSSPQVTQPGSPSVGIPLASTEGLAD